MTQVTALDENKPNEIAARAFDDKTNSKWLGPHLDKTGKGSFFQVSFAVHCEWAAACTGSIWIAVHFVGLQAASNRQHADKPEAPADRQKPTLQNRTQHNLSSPGNDSRNDVDNAVPPKTPAKASGVRVLAYSVTSANDEPGRDPKNWRLQGWDGEKWQTLDVRKNVFFASRYMTHTFCLERPAMMVGYRLLVDQVQKHGGDAVQFSRLELYDCDMDSSSATNKRRRLDFCSSPLALTRKRVDRSQNPDHLCRKEFGHTARQAGWIDLQAFPRQMLGENATAEKMPASGPRTALDAACEKYSRASSQNATLVYNCALWSATRAMVSDATSASYEASPWAFRAWVSVNGWR